VDAGDSYCLVRKNIDWRVFENGILRTFEPERKDVAGGWRKLHHEEFHNLL
jgi:hypothetical protein